MIIRFLDVADQEYRDAYDYYDGVVDQLGDEFKEEVTHALWRIKSYPNAWQKVSKHARRCRLERFPFGVVYQIRQDEILVLAVMHLHRDPGYWVSRVMG